MKQGDILEYKGYSTIIRFSAEDDVFHGKIADSTDLISFEGDTIDELELAFKDAVEDYQETLTLISKTK